MVCIDKKLNGVGFEAASGTASVGRFEKCQPSTTDMDEEPDKRPLL